LSFNLPTLSDEQREKLDQWIRNLLWEGTLIGITSSHHISVHRTKGRIVTTTGEEWILQGVREVYEFKHVAQRSSGDSKLVLIGERLNKHNIQQSLHRYLGV